MTTNFRFFIRFAARTILFIVAIFLVIGLQGAAQSAQPASEPLPDPVHRSAFVIEMDAPPVAQVYAQQISAGVQAADLTSITQAQLAAVENQQQALLSQLATLDADIIYRTQRVFNGIAVRIEPAQLAQIRSLPGVRAIHPLIRKEPHLARSLPVIGAPTLWQGVQNSKLTGEGIRVAVIDTGIDFIHSDFGGSGSDADYSRNDPTAITDGISFPNDKVIGGYDFVGETYNADPDSPTYQPDLQPDADPTDCYGHGTHVAGIVAGKGVRSNGEPYAGPYNKSLNLSSLLVAPGVAPNAQIYALKVFGCTGSTEVTDLAIEWAMDPNGDGNLSDHVDVINMSLGSSYGSQEDVSTIASNNAAAAGVIVVASAGNSGDVHYITGSPAVADRVISVAASGYDETTQSDLLASFSSRGPRRIDDMLKPDIAAPGVSIFSAADGTGKLGRASSGTSMAAPHVAGAMALLRQFHPDWTVQELKALVMNSAQPVIRTGTLITLPTYSAARVGAGRIDLNAAVATTWLAFNAEQPELVSLSFGAPNVLTTTTFTRSLAIENKSSQALSITLEYVAQVDLPGAEITLPQSAISVGPQSMVTVPVVLTVDPLALQRTHDETLRDIGLRYWLSEEIGLLELLADGQDRAIRVPLYANPQPASALALIQNSFDFGRAPSSVVTLTMTGTALSTTDVLSGYQSLVGLTELQWESPNNPPVEPDYPRLVVGAYDAADIHYVGVSNDIPIVHTVGDTTLYFAIATYANWSSPREVLFNIYVDSNGDGVDDYRVFNSDLLNISNESLNSDRFRVGIENLKLGDIRVGGFLNNRAANEGDAALFGNNLMIIPVDAPLLGLDDTNFDFNYYVESEIADISGIIDRSPRLFYTLHQQWLQPLAGDGSPIRAVGSAEDFASTYQFDAVKAGGQGKALLFYFHNLEAQRVEIVQLTSDIPKVYLPIVGR